MYGVRMFTWGILHLFAIAHVLMALGGHAQMINKIDHLVFLLS